MTINPFFEEKNIMNIEQNLHYQELSEENYTNVYGGFGPSSYIDVIDQHILPEKPFPPKSTDDPLNQQPPHTGIFGG